MANSVIKYENDFKARRTLTANDNLNDFQGIQYSGVYYITDTANAPINTPVDTSGTVMTYGVLIVICDGRQVTNSLTQQIYIRRANIFKRNYSGSPANWSSWTTIILETPGLTQSFREVGDIDTFISLAKQVAYHPIIIGGSSSLLKALTGQSGSGFIIAKYVDNQNTTSRIDYIAMTGATTLQGCAYQGFIKTSDSSVQYNKISNMAYGSLNGTLFGYGWITTSAKELDIFCPLSFRGTSINITKLTIAMRHSAGGYVGTSGQDVTSMITAAVLQPQQQLLRLVITNSNGWGLTNNTPIIGYVNITSTIS